MSLETIIGLAREEGCFEGWDDEYAESESGLYLSELQGIKLVDACGLEVYELMKRARANALLTLKNDITQEASRFIQPNRVPFSGDIGAVKFNYLNNTDGYYGVRIYTSVAGARIKYVGITFMPPATGNFELKVYSDFELLGTYPITGCTVKRPKQVLFSTPLMVTQGNTYFIVEGATAYTGKLTCCGSTSWCFDIDKPCYNTSKREWSNWCMVAGIHGANVDDRVDWKTFSKNYGLSVHASFTCNMDDLLYSEYSDFENNENDRALAFAYLYKTGEYFLNAVIDSGEVNRFTLLGHDAIDFNRAEYLKKYQQMVTWYTQNMKLIRNDCYSCKKTSRISNRFGVR